MSGGEFPTFSFGIMYVCMYVLVYLLLLKANSRYSKPLNVT